MKGTGARFLDAFLSMIKSRLITHTPFFLAHAITYACNSRCKTCTYWQMSPRREYDLTTDGVYALLDEAYDYGMRGYYLFGGEPLVRPDIEAVVEYAKRRGFLTTMNTNASLLAAKAAAGARGQCLAVELGEGGCGGGGALVKALGLFVVSAHFEHAA